MKSAKLIEPFRIDKPKRFRLTDHDPADTRGLEIDKQEAKSMLAQDIERLAELQEMLYAHHRWAVLAIFQAMDAGGKDSAIEHVMTGVNPQGCEVHAFKAPSAEELDHDFLWRAATRLPRRGHIGIFNRSHYEEVLVVRVRHELLVREELPPELTTNRIWKQRFEDIVAFERHLARNGTIIVKFHLRISKAEQKRRLRGHDPPHQHAGGAVVRGARGQQVVRAARGRGGTGRCARSARFALPQSQPGAARGNAARPQGARGGEGLIISLRRTRVFPGSAI